METQGRLKSLDRAYPAKNAVVSFEIAATPEECEGLRDIDLDIKLTKHRKRRSLDANAYYWRLVREIARDQGVSMTEVHNLMLSQYGQLDILEDGSLNRAIKPVEWNWMRSELDHYRFSERFVRVIAQGIDGEEQEELLPLYWVIRGSHTYDTAEMSELIEGIVHEAAGLGIETLTPDEIAHMMELYDKDWQKRNKIPQQEGSS